MEQYGWIYQAELVSQYERIELTKVYDMPTVHFLNDLAYLKSKNEYEALLRKKAYAKKY
jgi:hypothetical protein